jgi:hypothetical protein
LKTEVIVFKQLLDFDEEYTLLTTLGLANFLEGAAPAPSKGFDLGIWYALIIIGVVAFVVFYVVKRITDIAVNRKTQAMIRQFSEIKESDPSVSEEEEE